MKVLKRLLYAATAVAMLPLASCNDDGYELAPVPDGQEAYFVESQATEIVLTRTDSAVKIPVKRIQTAEAEVVQIMYEDESGLFTIPESVSFSAGADMADLTVGYDFSLLERGETYPVQLMIKGMNSPYGMSQIQIDLICPEPWNKLEGKGQYRDDIMTVYNGITGYESEVNVYEYDGRPGYYYIEDPYQAPNLVPYFNNATAEDLVNNVRATKFIIDATNPDAVTIGSQAEPQDCGVILNPTDGWLRVFSIEPGKLENGVITFPVEGLVAVIDAGSGKCNASGLFRVILPGTDIKDYSMGVTYGGMDVGSDNTTTKVKVDFTLGNDVESFAYVFVDGDAVADMATIAAKIVDGTAENVVKVTAEEVADALAGSDTRVVTMQQILNRGSYTIVAVPYGSDGAGYAEHAAAYSFFFPGMGDVPEVDATLAVGSPAGLLGDDTLEDLYPSTTSLAFEILGSDVRNIIYWLGPMDALDSVLAQGVTESEILKQYGADASQKKDPNGKTWMDYINEGGRYAGVFSNFDPNTGYSMLMEVESIYGSKKMLRANHKTSVFNYEGDFGVGTYRLTCKIDDELFENTFSVAATPTENEFLVTNIGIENGAVFYATYDPAALTFTLSGLEKGYENQGSQFGAFYGYLNAEKTQVYGFFTSETFDPKNVDLGNMNIPLVMKVDAATQRINSLETCLWILVANAEMTQLLGYYSVFDPAKTTVTYLGENTVKRASVGASKLRNEECILTKNFELHTAVDAQSASDSLHTVAVKASVGKREAVKEFVLRSKIK